MLLWRADAGHLELDLKPADVCEIMRACSDEPRILVEEREINIRADLPDER